MFSLKLPTYKAFLLHLYVNKLKFFDIQMYPSIFLLTKNLNNAILSLFQKAISKIGHKERLLHAHTLNKNHPYHKKHGIYMCNQSKSSQKNTFCILIKTSQRIATLTIKEGLGHTLYN